MSDIARPRPQSPLFDGEEFRDSKELLESDHVVSELKSDEDDEAESGDEGNKFFKYFSKRPVLLLVSRA